MLTIWAALIPLVARSNIPKVVWHGNCSGAQIRRTRYQTDYAKDIYEVAFGDPSVPIIENSILIVPNIIDLCS